MTRDELIDQYFDWMYQLVVDDRYSNKSYRNLISDSTWSAWATELEELQKKYPDIAAKVPYAEEFKDFDHSTGMNLPLDDPWAVNKARQLLAMKDRGFCIQCEQLEIKL